VLCPVLVGREEEARHIEAALAGAAAGTGGTLLVTGEAGIGKSRLVCEAAGVAGAHEFAVLTGRAVAVLGHLTAMLPLGRLGLADSARMARACVGAAGLPDAVQSLVAQRAEGLPFLVEEVLASLIGGRSLIERDGRWEAGDLSSRLPRLPPGRARAFRRCRAGAAGVLG